WEWSMISTGVILACEFHSGRSLWLPPWGDPRKSRSGILPPEGLERLPALEVVPLGLGDRPQLALALQPRPFSFVAVLDRLGHVRDAVTGTMTRASPVCAFHRPPRLRRGLAGPVRTR